MTTGEHTSRTTPGKFSGRSYTPLGSSRGAPPISITCGGAPTFDIVSTFCTTGGRSEGSGAGVIAINIGAGVGSEGPGVTLGNGGLTLPTAGAALGSTLGNAGLWLGCAAIVLGRAGLSLGAGRTLGSGLMTGAGLMLGSKVIDGPDSGGAETPAASPPGSIDTGVLMIDGGGVSTGGAL